MKKILFAFICAAGCMVASAYSDETITNVYDFTASLRVPYLSNGVRNYKTQKLSGYLYTELVDGQAAATWLALQNKSTKVAHIVEFTSGFYHLMGKATKYSDRSVPTVFYEASDIYVTEGTHELIEYITFAGTGSLKSVKSVTTECGCCSVPTKSTTYCNVLYKMNGYATGIMDCQCPDEENWTHTLQTRLCGVYVNDSGEVVPEHDAAIWGTWSATFNKKLSDTKIK